MIGVDAPLSHHDVIREFFELFKTEWEFERPEIAYDVVIRSNCDLNRESNARLVLVYQTQIDQSNSSLQGITRGCRNDRILLFNKDRLPIYGRSLSFDGSSENYLVDELTRESVIRTLTQGERRTVLWIGYDLWDEIRHLLTCGQPEVCASIPAVELHIELLRALLRKHQIELAEVPPVPDGHKFIACLTHDVDHASIRAHKLDRTIVGFAYRAVVQSLFHFCTGRKSFADLLRNWASVISLPLIQLGLMPDIWSRFERYTHIENGLPSTFFFVPRSGDAGRLRDDGPAPKLRAVRYNLRKFSGLLRRLAYTGHEIALHGINAWLAAKEGIAERAALQKAVDEAGSAALTGVRMHWLYYDESSAKAIDEAGFRYDSTVGYNRTIGYRSGSCQVYQPLGTVRLKELPLHVMDTALFFPEYMNLKPVEAKTRIGGLIANAMRFGGVLTINWHDRSIAPERLWDRVYADILAELKKSGAWFATASDAVAWFEKRRAFRFDSPSGGSSESNDRLPGLTIKEYGQVQQIATLSEAAELTYC